MDEVELRTLIAVSLMVVIYFVFFSPKPDQQEQLLKPETQQQELAADTSVEKLADAPQESVVREEILELSNELSSVRVNGLGSILNVELHNYFVEPNSDERIVWDFQETSGLNKQFLFIPNGNIQWKITERAKSYFVAEGRAGEILISRRLELLPDSYIIKLTDELRNKGAKTVEVKKQVQLQRNFELGVQPSFWKRMLAPQTDFQQAVWFNDGSLETEMLESLPAQETQSGSLSWAGFSTKYFFFGLVAENFPSLELQRPSPSLAQQTISLPPKQVPPGESRNFEVQYYVGPKEISELQQAGSQLERVIDYGNWIGPISRLLLSILRFFHDWIPNYGVGIILLTILVKLLLFPLAYKSAVSMRKLQIIQPRMKEIRDKYKDNPQRMNAEMMALYRTEKVNPIGGCLPLLLQMPVFFALYRVFFASIEMRHEPFFGWIQDLSHYDPYFITPILMTGLMYFQQKLTPMPNVGGEETEAIRIQKAMFKWMPFIFGAIMLFLPAGLTLYFLVNALLSILQQLYMNRKLSHLQPGVGIKAVKVANGDS